MTNWPRRREPDAGWPAPLRQFEPADWQEWLLDGPDPAQEGLLVPLQEWYAPPHPMEFDGFRGTGLPAVPYTEMIGIGDRPEVVAAWRTYHAHKRWSAARIAWLKARGLPSLETWLEDVRYEHHVLRRGLYA
jgi:hypothetical protein